MTTSPAGGGNLADLVRRAGQRFGDRPALIGDGPDRTWSDLDAAADAGAADLLESGVRRGDRVLISLPTSADLALVTIAVARAGLVAVPVDPNRPAVAAVAGRVQANIAVAGDASAVAGAALRSVLTPNELVAWWTGRRAPVDAIGGGEELAILARASRSDRAVMIPHRAVLAAVQAIVGARGVAVTQDDRAVLALPLFHLAGLVTAFLPLAAVGAAAVIPGPDTGEGDGGLGELIRRHRVTLLPGSPMIYRRLLKEPGAERSLASVRLLTSGAAPLLPEDFSAIRSLTGQSVWEGYGISESSSVVATSLMTGRARPGSVGLPVAGLQVRIVGDDEDEADDNAADDKPADDNRAYDSAADGAFTDDQAAVDGEVEEPTVDEPGVRTAPVEDTATGEEAAGAEAATAEAASDEAAADPGATPGQLAIETPDNNLAVVGSVGEVGRIALRGPTLFLGYWPDAADGPDEDGWYCTADVGYTDDLGELHLVDRVTDTFVVDGFTVYPKEIERVLADHLQVAEAVVVGTATTAGSHVVALIVARPDTVPTSDDLAEFVADRLPVFKRPNEFRLVGELPRTELGRIDRPAALLDYLESAEPPAAAAAAPEAGHSDAAEPELADLGTRLPGAEAAARGRRALDDTDEDLFGEDYS
jgi:long-chain acyl-CoA synthetase